MEQPIPKEVQPPSISLKTEPTNSSPPRSKTLIFFIPGNPGLIHYYTTYLNTLLDLLTPKCTSQSTALHIYGQSHAGFSDLDVPVSPIPYTLEEQIIITNSRLSALQGTHNYNNIILIGHSMGSYMLLELLRRSKADPSPSLPFVGGIMLFPTVTHIAQSPSGVKISKLFRIPEFPRRVALATNIWLSAFPWGILQWVVGLVTGMPIDAAKVTTGFLKSRMGIWQALNMAKEEMETITEDRWDDEVWGVSKSEDDEKRLAAKLIFYFGQNDHWVADHTRDSLIAARSRREDDARSSKPTMIIDQAGIPHGFCIKHSEITAEKTAVWVEDILWGCI